MSQIRFLFLIILLGCLQLHAQGIFQIFVQANQAYQKQQYQQAVDLYQQILSQGYQSEEVYYNLGNCFYRLNLIGEAILYYEKSLRLDPRDEDVRYNLELANLQVIDRIELPPRLFLFEWWANLKSFFSIDQLTSLVATLFAFVILLLIFWMYVKRYRVRRWLLTFATVAGILTIIWAYILMVRADNYWKQREAIVLSSTVTVLSAPDENSTDVFLLHEGVKVYLEDQRDIWVKISLPDGKSGWMKSKDMGII
jgi:tetratricopeptide (TPR) repeat protein